MHARNMFLTQQVGIFHFKICPALALVWTTDVHPTKYNIMRKGKRYNLVHPREWILLHLQHHIHKHPCDSDVVKQLCVYPNIAAVYSKYICCLFISLYVYIHFFTIAHGGGIQCK